MNNKKSIGLEQAYSVETPRDNKKLYKNWAESYDSDFANDRGYHYPRRVAELYKLRANSNDEPVLDVGAGTGLVAHEMLKLADLTIDAVDISSEMLEQSKAKGLYRYYIEADLTQPLSIADETYGGIVSVGTFTLGHVGPNAFLELLRIAKVDALFCIAINAKFFDQSGFGSAFADLQANGLISPLEFVKCRYYQNAKDQHAEDTGYTAIFRKR